MIKLTLLSIGWSVFASTAFATVGGALFGIYLALSAYKITPTLPENVGSNIFLIFTVLSMFVGVLFFFLGLLRKLPYTCL
tara:strand:- start:101 stop:340 length:240 start_codon:yes stop_codon:yes gene_type:complete